MCYLSCLDYLDIDGFWSAFEEIPPTLVGLKKKLAFLRERLDSIGEPLM